MSEGKGSKNLRIGNGTPFAVAIKRGGVKDIDAKKGENIKRRSTNCPKV